MQLDGDQLRQARVAAGFTLRQFALKVGLSPGYLSHTERNSPSHPVTPATVAMYEKALGRRVDAVVSEDVAEMRRRQVLLGLAASTVVLPGLQAESATMVSGLESALYGAAPGFQPVTLAQLNTMIQSGRADFAAVRLSALASKVPALIKVAMASRDAADDGQKAAFEAALSRVCVLGNELAIKLHEHQLAAVLADRAVTAGRASQDPLTVAEALWRAAISMRRSKHADSAGRVIAAAAQELYDSTGLDTPQRAGMYARMLCSGAYTAAMAQQPGSAYDLLRHAQEVVTEHRPSSFTADDARLYGISVARAVGDFGRALEFSRAITPGALRDDERRMRRLEDTAIAFWGAGKPAETFRMLLLAEQISRDEVTKRPWAQRLTLNLLSAHPKSGLAEVRQFAKRIGVGGSPAVLT